VSHCRDLGTHRHVPENDKGPGQLPDQGLSGADDRDRTGDLNLGKAEELAFRCV
jgi:hypothetical protein